MQRPLARFALFASLTAAALAGCGGTSPSPCASCLAVSGSYSETTASTQVNCGDQLTLYFSGGGQTHVDQQGSTLTLSTPHTSLPGVLHADGSASFGPIDVVAKSVDSSGQDTPGKLYLDGFFKGGAGAGSATGFAGTYVFIADSDGCEIDSRATWQR